MKRYLWTLDREDQQTRSGLSTENELIAILPCVMPSDWLVATMQMDIEGSGLAIHESAYDPKMPWKLQIKPAV
ncbi:hypothetical protein IB244_01630 [Rhizobium sp. RHZ02]|uniref:hypothetical protein n=1 Tax=Rhizobium sp. RHZ02 TaxID=2769306 RepID=UPI001786765E|nr:hypothetical protein [Rhizobium sp. RHZ02]MBD9450280.1 hypothetical protein [Rhizobium sp. RHZ02]